MTRRSENEEQMRSDQQPGRQVFEPRALIGLRRTDHVARNHILTDHVGAAKRVGSGRHHDRVSVTSRMARPITDAFGAVNHSPSERAERDAYRSLLPLRGHSKDVGPRARAFKAGFGALRVAMMRPMLANLRPHARLCNCRGRRREPTESRR